MTNITQLKREAIADRVTGWQGDPIQARELTAQDVLSAIRSARISDREAIEIVRALSCRIADRWGDDDVIAILDQASDDMTVPIARAEEAASLKAGWESLQHEADIQASWA